MVSPGDASQPSRRGAAGQGAKREKRVIIRNLIAAVAVVAIPLAVVGAQEPAPRSSKSSTKKICETNVEIGSRLNRQRRCRTKAEHDEHKAEARQTVDRIQAFKATTCPPNC